MRPEEVLALPMLENDAEAATVGEYLLALLREVWRREEEFSGKRPFGSSGWKHDVYRALIKGGAAEGTLDADGYVDEEGDADEVLLAAIDALIPSTV